MSGHAEAQSIAVIGYRVAKSKMELTNTNSVFMDLCAVAVMWGHHLAATYESCLMPDSANVIDFNSYRKRRQARAMAELMWAMYATRATRASVASFTITAAKLSSETRQA